MSEETKRKIGIASKGHILSRDVIERIRYKNLGKKRSEDTRQRMRTAIRRKQGKRGPLSIEHKLKIGRANHGNSYKKGKTLSEERKGKNHFRWIKDRNKLKRYGDDQKNRRSSAYVTWRKEVWTRDKFKCRMLNSECRGRIEAHHILSYTSYPDLRYDINNGITLCHFHHPRKRVEEARLSPFFHNLICKI